MTEGVLTGAPNLVDRTHESVVTLLSLHHLSGNVESLVDPVVAYHHWYNEHVAPKRLISFKEPSDGQVRLLPAVQFASSESLLILVDCSDLVVRDNLLQHLTINVVALQGLSGLAAREDVAAGFEPLIDDSNAWGVLVVAKSVAELDALSAGYKHLDKEVKIGFIQWYYDDLVILRDQVFHSLHRT